MKKSIFKISFSLLSIAIILTGSIRVLGQINTPQGTINSNWTLLISGAVKTPLNLTVTELSTMPKTQVYGELFCEGVLLYASYWGGIKISTLLQKAEVDPSATNLEFYASDGYNINVAIAAAQAQDMIISYELEGYPLPENLRLILPNYPGFYWISSITEIKVTTSTKYNIEPPEIPPPPITQPQEPTPPASSTPQPTIEPTPEPTQTPTATNQPTPTSPPTPETTFTPIESPTQTPTNSQQPANPETQTPSQTTPPTPTPTATLIETEPPNTPTNEPLTNQQQIQPATVAPSGFSSSYLFLAVAAAIVTGIVGLIVYRRRHIATKKESSNLPF